MKSHCIVSNTSSSLKINYPNSTSSANSMSEPHVGTQDEWFYHHGWSAAADNSLMHSLICHKLENRWGDVAVPRRAILAAKVDIKFFTDSSFTASQISQRVRFMQRRFKVFKALVNNTTDFQWNPATNDIIGDLSSWKKAFKNNILAKAYYHKGEPEFDKMMEVFSFNAVKIESGDTVKVNSGNTVILLSDDEEEVSSPVITARRKLFSDDAVQSDEQSTTAGEFPTRNAFPPRFRQKPSKGASSSSCASSSPNYWFNNQ